MQAKMLSNTSHTYNPDLNSAVTWPAVPVWMSWGVIGIVCLQMALGFSRRTILFEDVQLSLYMSLLNYGLLVGLCLRAPGRFRVLLRDKYVTLFLLFLVNCAFVDYVSATLLYDQPLLGILRTTFRSGGLLVFPILFMTMDEQMFRRLVRALLILGCAGAFFTIILWSIPSLAELIVQERRISVRFDRTRLPVLFDSIVYFLFFYSFVKMVKFNNVASGAMWVVCLFVIFYINMTRQIILAFSGAMLFFVLVHLNTKKIIEMLTVVFVLSAAILLLSPGAFDIFGNTINSIIDPSSEGYGNVAVRKEAAAFYWDQFQKTNFVGFGRISIVHGGQNPIQAEFDVEAGGRLFAADINLIGTFCQYGFGLLLIVITGYIYAFSDVRQVISRVSQRDYAVLCAIELMMVAEILRLGTYFSNESSAFYWCLFLFIIAYYSKCTIKHRN